MTEPVIVLDPTARRVYFDDTFDAFAAFRDQRPGVCATIEADPLGTVNRIVRICRMDGGRRVGVKAALVPITAGTTVQLSWRIPKDSPELRELPTKPGWRIDVDGQTVLRVPDSDIWPVSRGRGALDRWLVDLYRDWWEQPTNMRMPLPFRQDAQLES